MYVKYELNVATLKKTAFVNASRAVGTRGCDVPPLSDLDFGYRSSHFFLAIEHRCSNVNYGINGSHA